MEHGLKLKPSKCNFFHTEISYLGHKVYAAGMEPGTDGLKGIAEIAPPATYTQVRKFLGATGYFRHFIKGYARIAKPLNDLLQGENSRLKSHPLGLPPDALAAFQELKMKCLMVPVLAFADFKKPFLLETDALIEGLGVVLSQKQDNGRYHPIAYASHGLKGGELKYHSSKLEFLALKWALTEQFREYLQYQPFLVCTDNNPLTYVMTMPNLDAVGHRWVAAISAYNFKIVYVCRTDNKVVDALSRVGGHLDEEAVKELLDQDAIKELLNHAMRYGIPRVEADNPRVVEEHKRAEGEIIMQARMLVETKRNYQNLADSQWVVAQRGDRAIRLVMDWLRRKKDDNHTLDQYLRYHVPDAEHRIYAACQKDFVLRRNLLYLRVMPKRSNEDVLVFVVPGLKRQVVIDGCHHYLGHQGRDRTLSLLKERFWWPGMAQRMMMSVRNCPKCCIFEAKPQIPPMEPVLCTEPLDLVHIDYVSMEMTVGVKETTVVKNVLVVEDHFTRFTQTYVTNNHTARTTARILYNEFFSVIGFPRRLMSDQAPEFTGQVISELCDLLSITKIRTSPYHLQTNGAVERVHQTLRRMIAKMDPEKRAKWPSHLGPILITCNTTRSLITGYSPYFLMFGHRPRLPVDLLFPTVRRDENSRTTDEYVMSLYNKLKSALASARDAALLEAQRQKRLYDRKARAVELHPGDKVLVKLDAFRGQQRKLKNRWGDALYTVVKCMADRIPAYEVENDANKKRQVLHRAKLLLWLAEPEGEPLRMNRMSIESGLTRAELGTPLHRSVKLGVVLHKLIYGLNTAMFESRGELPDLTTGDVAQGALTGAPHNGTGHRIPCDKFSHWRTLRALLRDVSAS